MKNDLQKAIDEQKPEVKEIKKRELLILTDGQNIEIAKSEWSGLELEMGLIKILNQLQNKT